MALFEKGRQKTGGRGKGARNRLSVAFLEAFAKDFEEHGEAAIITVRAERPHEYLKVVAALMPKEFEINDNRLAELPDDELAAVIDYIRSRLANRLGDTGSREEQTTH